MIEGREKICICPEKMCHRFGEEKVHIFDRKTSFGFVKPVKLEQCIEYQIQEDYLLGQETKPTPKSI